MAMFYLRTFNRFILISLALLGLTACGGGGGGSASSGENTGVFVDSEVGGVRFVTATREGTTDSTGSFTYASGETVSFYVGDILIGQATGSPLITPVQLVSGADDATDPTVTNIARFLQTLDEDGNPDNGITITDSVIALTAGQSVNFNESTTDFTNNGAVQTLVATLTAATSAGARSLVSVADAQSHLNSSIFNAFSGAWSGTYTSSYDSGTWSVIISTNGSISGSGVDGDGDVFTISGSVNTSGNASLTAGGTSSGARFSGTADYSNGTISGTWVNTGITDGTWSGSKN
jgi:hypothetical protein